MVRQATICLPWHSQSVLDLESRVRAEEILRRCVLENWDEMDMARWLGMVNAIEAPEKRGICDRRFARTSDEKRTFRPTQRDCGCQCLCRRMSPRWQ